ncbi:unnamed protein product (macronuclear) [Paramecium tetraurelia]|uniref:Uncharacterized protein n=1 Tax=Paramecium tetraurelia TaxID=5888 RepID=A0CPY6_PARTE|nr:uncharacterized protein GSPATT00038810001 [Paramecium tetraurelia]CAK72853.1 unnamed protein product [Paramecium tetraurelia]|eukprot:XP_001440250.1 hypothetical protein (macronuclear) [Paramecium tetraurelia strain d4-2]
MIFKNFYNLLFYFFLLIGTQEISEQCVCGHVRRQTQCQNSGICIWQNGVCVLNSAKTYIQKNQGESSCKVYAEEDCRLQKQCGFYLGQLFKKDQCQQSSYRCASDGTKCVEIFECKDYKTEVGCAYQNQNGGYCFWVQDLVKMCRDVATCEELPIYLGSHIQCKQGLAGCTVNEQGYGCIRQKDECAQYFKDFQCFDIYQKKQICFWDSKNSRCVEKVCQNLPFSQDYECKQILSECTSNGIHCIQRKQCSDAKNKISCVTDAQGNKCEYFNNKCKIKGCDTALSSLKSYLQCQDYDNQLDCVTNANGGCKQRPQTCKGYVDAVDCYSIEKQDCIWYKNKCEQRACYHAPLYYTPADCKQYGNCMGKEGGGCLQMPDLCNENLKEQFCEFNYNNQKCISLEGIWTLFECKKLKLPNYKNPKICQEVSSNCAINLEILGCKDYICKLIQEIEFCSFNSQEPGYTTNQGCVDKKCITAPSHFESNSQCEMWLPYCTVNVQELQNQKLLFGCVDKKSECQFAIEEQCYSTFSGTNCKWDKVGKMCIDQICTDANPNIYQTNEDCNSYKVLQGTCILRSSGSGCQLWPTTCHNLIIQQQCQLNLQDGTRCFWTGSLCKTLECSDASVDNYKNNIQCNTWLDYCIFNRILGGCMNRPSLVDCALSPNDEIYDSHVECQAWNPNCTVISSLSLQGCEQKKANCSEYIRQRNCKTSLAGQNCYWDDYEQKCYEENDAADCSKRIYGDLLHQNCENFLQKCTIKQISGYCVALSSQCDYKLEQQCVITSDQQPCKWDVKNRVCKDVNCSENTTAQTEAECLKFRKLSQCQLKIQPNGTYGPGCEARPVHCDEVTHPLICKLTLTQQNERCYFFNSRCQVVQSYQCEAITDSKSNEVCQLYNLYCVLQTKGKGCYSIYSCSDLSSNVCKSAIMKFDLKCNYYGRCRSDNYCSDKNLLISNCDGRKTPLGQLCYYQKECDQYYCNRKCLLQTATQYLQFQSSATFSDRNKQCQDYSSNYIYDTSCQCCKSIYSCSQQLGEFQACNSSTVTSSSTKRCGYNFWTNSCESRTCEHLTFANYPIITDQICFDWKSDCVLDSSGCKTFYYDCSQSKIISQCYQFRCNWQDGKCVYYLNCETNITAVTNRECLLVNAEYCRFNYTKGQGCGFFNCNHIKQYDICNSATLVDGQHCYWEYSKCQYRSCSQYTIQSKCESSYGQNNKAVVKCYWCQDFSTKCSNNKYCNLSSMTSPKSHQDCNDENSQQTIEFYTNVICVIKQSLCSEYSYQEACVSTLNGESCYWSANLCNNKCEAATTNPSTNQQCYDWDSGCMLQATSQCQLLNCSLLTLMSDCDIYSTKCFWDGSNCKTIGACSEYSTSILCSNNNNSEEIPCFWNSTTCIEKTCQNIPTVPSTISDCNNWLTNCQLDSNGTSCVEDCTSADDSHNTHDQCESYYSNKSCTVKPDIIQCVDLPISCGLAAQEQCYLDSNGNSCYYSISTQTCLILTCANLDTNFKSHEQCNQKLKQCTVNATLNGCQLLNSCNSYQIKEQCFFDQNNIECEWVISSNACIIKECSSAQFNLYTAHGCRLYFGDSCTVNSSLDGCETGQLVCLNYNYQQCISDGQINLSGVGCFWNEEKKSCQERICTNGPSDASSHFECSIFLSSCQLEGCHMKGCLDYFYAIDSACTAIFQDKRCITNGIRCVKRKECENVTLADGCTFDSNLNRCVWIDEKCYTKSCQTAQVTLTKFEECNSYMPNCTVKQDGGCTNRQSCQDYQIKEACYTDFENFECIWDSNISKCFSSQCVNFCGDGIVTGMDEYCDDGNYLPYDGCYKCQVQCPLGCNKCNGKSCQECDKNGWQLSEGVCTTKCGDGYAVGNEQCDDGNDLQFDGCYLCSYQCDKMCVECFQGQCIQCQVGFVEDGYQCHNTCGDGYLAQQLEQCDDGNLENNDGCSEICKVEKDWKCSTENSISVCIYAILPKMILTKLSKTDTSSQEFKLSFSEPVCLNEKGISEEQFLQLIVIEIINAKQDEYDYEINAMISITTELADVAYKILINFKTNVKNPALKVKVNSDNIVNSQGNTLSSKEAKLEFRSPYKISDDQLSLISKTSMLSRIVLYFIVVISGISFLCGNLEILWNLLDIASQQLSYIKFHNIEFPQNLESYFEIFTIGSFTPIVDKLQIDQSLRGIFNFEIPVIQAKWKFEQYQINCYFLQNFQTLLMMLIMGFTYFIVSYLFLRFLFQIKYQNWPAIYQKAYFYQIVKLFFFLQSIARQYYQYFIYSGLIRIFTSNFYESTYASLLQLVNLNIESTLNTTISIVALFTLLFNIFLLSIFFFYLNQKNAVAKNLSVLVEGIKNQKNQGVKQYFTIMLIKKTLFIINLVAMQGLMGAQSLITALLSGVFSCYFCIFKPFKNNFENIKIIITELLIALNVLIFSLYEILKQNQDKESAERLGWINIGGFTFILLTTLAIDMYQQLTRYTQLVIAKVKICLKINQRRPKISKMLFI